MVLSVTHISYSNGQGGAGIAAARINSALIQFGIYSKLGVAEDFKQDGESFIISGKSTFHSKIRARFLFEIARYIYCDKNYHSFNILPSKVYRAINDLDSDIINLHWINRELLSYYEISKICKPIFWTLHDMWPLLGSTHHEFDVFPQKIKQSTLGSQIEKFLNTQKSARFRNNINWIAPSNWMRDRIVEKFSYDDQEIAVIPNPIDTRLFKSLNPNDYTSGQNFYGESPTILFGAAGGINNRLKGFQYLYESFRIMRRKLPGVKLALFGQEELPDYLDQDNDVINLGVIYDQFDLCTILNKCTLLALPSIIDNLPQVAVEAVCSGTPVVAFEVGGISDIIENGENGFTVQFGDVYSFAEAMTSIIEDRGHLKSREEISQRSHLKYSFENIAKEYTEYYAKKMS